MTEKDIDNLKVGNILDGLIQSMMRLPVTYAAKSKSKSKHNGQVGYKCTLEEVIAICSKNHERDEYWQLHPEPSGNPQYSSDWRAAGKVIEWLRNSGKYCCLKLTSDFSYVYDFSLTIYNQNAKSDEDHKPNFISTDESPMMAICKTALKAKFL